MVSDDTTLAGREFHKRIVDGKNEGSGYSSGSGWQVFHAIRPVRPRDSRLR